ALPFVYSGSDGLIVHDAVRDAIAGHLRATDPATYRELRRRAWQQLRDEVRTAGIEELWRYTADVLYILENPVIREAFFPSGGPQYTVEVMRDRDDHAAIERLAAMHETPEAAAHLHGPARASPRRLQARHRQAGIRIMRRRGSGRRCLQPERE